MHLDMIDTLLFKSTYTFDATLLKSLSKWLGVKKKKVKKKVKKICMHAKP